MDYRRLPYDQYFINTGEDFNHTGRLSRVIDYVAVKYTTGKLEKALGLSHEVNYAIHYEPERDVIQINFQRTVGAADWFANVFEFSSRYYDAIDFEDGKLQLRVHHGWGNMYKAIKWEIRNGWKALHDEHPEAATEILGWSLGSGIACLCAQDLNFNFGLKAYLYTFGSVRPFKAARRERGRMREYLDTLCKRALNFADVNDVISYMPPFRGFMMIGRYDLGKHEKRTLPRLLHPYKYHTHYDRPELYRGIE
jgi:hypothetical protein